MNNISEKQNESKSLDFLFVQRALYSSAKGLFVCRITMTLVIAIGGPIITSLDNALGVYVGMVAIAYLVLDNFCLERFESGKRLSATKVQEMFDTYVLSLPWSNVVAGKKLDPEVLGGVLDASPIKDYSKLESWYPNEVRNVDLSLARFLCQRSNGWWDTNLRRVYTGFWIIVLATIILLELVFGVESRLTVTQFLLGIIVPALPLAEVAIKQIKDNLESASTISELKGNIDEVIDKVFADESIDDVDAVSRVFQDQLFRHRSKCPMVFDWVYLLMRNRQEKQMQFSIKAKVNEYLKRTNPNK